MPVHDFDKTVQEKAHELRLDPSPAVWQGVEDQLNKRRRRKGAAWFFLAASIIAGILSWYIIDNNADNRLTSDGLTITPTGKDNKNTKTTEKNNTLNDNNSTLDQNDIAGENTDADQKITNRHTEPVLSPETANTDNNLSSAPEYSGKGTSEGNNKTAIITDRLRTEDKLSSAKRYSAKQAGATTKKSKNRNYHPADCSAVTQIEITDEVSERTAAASDANTFQRELNPSLVNSPLKDNPAFLVTTSPKERGNNSVSSNLLKPQKLSIPKKWEYSLHFAVGASSQQHGVFEQNKASTMDFLNAPIGPNGFAPVPIPHQPSDVKAGPSLQLGANLNRHLGKKTTIGIGIQYNFLSNRIKIGDAVDSTVAIYNSNQQRMSLGLAYSGSGNTGSEFYNRYHLIQIPLEFTWNIDRHKRIFWNNGINIGYLVASHVLQYNNQAGLYYRDNNSLRKWQSGVFSGLQYRFLPAGGTQVSIGPYAQYQLSSIDKSNNNKRMLFVGLGAKLHLKNKKK